MSCKSCQSTNQRVFESEISIHFPELKNLRRSPVIAFPDLLICFNCGFTETRIEDGELHELMKDGEDSKSSS